MLPGSHPSIEWFFFGTICGSLQVQLPPYLIIYIIQFLAEQFDCSNCRLGPFGNDGTPQPTMMLDYHVLYWHCHKNVGVHQQNLFERPMKPGNFRGGTWTDAARLVLRSFYIQVHIWQNWMTGIYIYIYTVYNMYNIPTSKRCGKIKENYLHQVRAWQATCSKFLARDTRNVIFFPFDHAASGKMKSHEQLRPTQQRTPSLAQTALRRPRKKSASTAQTALRSACAHERRMSKCCGNSVSQQVLDDFKKYPIFIHEEISTRETGSFCQYPIVSPTSFIIFNFQAIPWWKLHHPHWLVWVGASNIGPAERFNAGGIFSNGGVKNAHWIHDDPSDSLLEWYSHNQRGQWLISPRLTVLDVFQFSDTCIGYQTG